MEGESMNTPTLDTIIAHGNAPSIAYAPPSWVVCADGFVVSVLAGGSAYSAPRVADGCVPADYPGPYTAVEVGLPTARPEPWGAWAPLADDPADPTGTLYGPVPVAMVRDLVLTHGGEDAEATATLHAESLRTRG